GDILDFYLRTDGVWMLTRNKQLYKTNNEKECAEKCEAERNFTCRAFLFTWKKLQCLTLAENAKMTVAFPSMDTVLYQKRSMCTVRGYSFTHQAYPNGILLYTPEKHPNAGLEENYCRNPDADENGPWCYTTDPAQRFDYCAIPDCEDQCMQCNGEDYHGEVSRTESGLECQRWDVQEPHMHGFTLKQKKEVYIFLKALLTTLFLPSSAPPLRFLALSFSFFSFPVTATPPPASGPDSQCLSGRGEDYRGRIAITESGNACQHWNTQHPHKHGWIPDRYPCKGLQENYCRNPDGEKKPWCYTTNSSIRWEYCTIPPCDRTEQGIAGMNSVPVQVPLPEECYRGKGQSYRGTTSVTASGKKCQAWSSMVPHSHIKTPDRFPEA
ncbi:PLMN protein, partial [Horornis vulcanius]|nr:PLMN protein [Horornis vulcanius]